MRTDLRIPAGDLQLHPLERSPTSGPSRIGAGISRSGRSRPCSSAIHEIFEVIDVASVIPGVAPHAEDDAILAAGVAGRVDAIVTGDRQMLDRRSYEGTRIVTPRQFVDLLATP